jgi:hypothetical protein
MKTLKSGFTIIEVSVAGVLIVALGFGILSLNKVIQDSQLFGITNFTNVDQANFSLTQMTRELRTMRSGQNGAYAFVSGNDNDISFYTDYDYDGVSELVRYYLQDGTFYKSVIEPVGFPATYPQASAVVKPLSENVENTGTPVFLYFNEDWPQDSTNNPLPTPVSIADVRLVRLSLTINSNDNVGTGGYTLNTNVSFRILKDNL